ncbi:MAG: radical SAM protein [Actinobacteria bacterium]|nr:radical SAM protein [Actinomycetota bacterium]
MYEARSPAELLEVGRKLQARGGRGLLISGGSLADGTVPLHDFLEAIGELKQQGLSIAVHTGLVDERLAEGLARAGIDIAMIDIIGDDGTIRDVYHLDATTADFEDSLRYLCQSGVRTAPHVVIGLHFGEIKGEASALEMISRHEVTSLVLVALTSQQGTPMQDVAPPSPEELGEIFLKARLQFPRLPILLGCARPYGEHKLRTDSLALKAGLNGIAYPAEGIVELAADLGLEPGFSEQCCALIYQEETKDGFDEKMASAGHGSTAGD